MLTAQTFKTLHSDIFTFLHGDLEIGASHVHIPEEAVLGSLIYVSDAAQLAEARLHRPAILIVPANMSCLDAPADGGSCCLSVAHDRASGNDCMISAHALVENDARIGDRSVLHPHVFVCAGCKIGYDCANIWHLNEIRRNLHRVMKRSRLLDEPQAHSSQV